jgi:guanosine-3',5'-bis(diphosphate) 3'-pyrophosphohydrolase
MIRFNDILDKVSSAYSDREILLLKKAYVFAASAHQGHLRRSGEPYLSHPLEVASMLADLRLDYKALAAGLLHDVLEDTEVTPAELRKAFGQEVLDLVEGVTKISRVQEASTEDRQAETIQKIILAMTDDLRVIFIKLADRVHNLKTLNFLNEGQQRRIAQETLEVYAPVAGRLGMGRIKAELEDMAFRYVAPEEYFRVSALVEPQRQKAEGELEGLKAGLQALMDENGIPAEIVYRVKRLYSIWDKMKRQGISFDQVYDFLALRLITDTPKNCYSALYLIHQKWTHIPQRFRDFIAMPKSNLYQALHTTIITEGRQTFEVQVRTREMHTLAENGIAAHWKYKERDSRAILREDRRLQWLRDLVDLYEEQKSPREFLRNLKTNLTIEDMNVFTPKGRVVTLPAGSSVLDFAFKVHSEIGLHCAGARVNSRPVPFKTILRSGDIVEIVTAPDKHPQRSWLNIAFTSTARHRIRHWLNLKSRSKSRALGKKLWDRKTRLQGLPADYRREESLMKLLPRVAPQAVRTIDDFYALVGRGQIVVDRKFLERLMPAGEAPGKEERAGTRGEALEIERREAASELVGLARCCAPIRGEPIIGYITMGKGITVHADRCPLVAKEVLDKRRMVEVTWDTLPPQTYTGRLVIRADDSPGLLAGAAAAVAELEGNISRAEVKTSPDKKAQIEFSLVIRDIKHLEDIRDRLRRVEGVSSVERM